MDTQSILIFVKYDYMIIIIIPVSSNVFMVFKIIWSTYEQTRKGNAS